MNLVIYFWQDDKNETPKIEAAHFSDLDAKTMKIQELRDQLDARGLSSKGKYYFFYYVYVCFLLIIIHLFGMIQWIFPFSQCQGLKPQLIARLSKALKSEENESISAEHLNESNAEATENKADSNNSNDINECASNDSMDIDLDLDNIVVIDEYDSTKNDSKHESSSKRVRIISTTSSK